MTTFFRKVVIPEGCSRESVFAVVVTLRNDRSRIKTLRDDGITTQQDKAVIYGQSS